MVGIFYLFLAFSVFFALPISFITLGKAKPDSLITIISSLWVVVGFAGFFVFGSLATRKILNKQFGIKNKAIERTLVESCLIAFCGCGAAVFLSKLPASDNQELIVLVIGSCLIACIRLFSKIFTNITKHTQNFTKHQATSNIPISQTSNNYSTPSKNINGDYVVYHGTKDPEKVRKIITEGLKPGGGDAYGTGVYMAEMFDDARERAGKGGLVFELHIDGDTPYCVYETIPGNNPKEKWNLTNDSDGLIWIESKHWFIKYGFKDIPVLIPGLFKVLVRDYWGNYIDI